MPNTHLIPQTSIGADTFRELVEKSTVIVDKSLLIKEFLQNVNKVNLITYPRRWGKTINMDMLKTFLELEVDEHGKELLWEQKRNNSIFAEGKWQNGKKVLLNIWQEQDIVEQYFGKYPVISVTFKDVRGSSYDEIKLKVITQISNLYEQHSYLLNSDKLQSNHKNKISEYIQGSENIADLENSLKNLSIYLYKHFKKLVFILIDEYDTPINHANLKFKDATERENVVELFRGILGGALKGNDYMERGLVTGILRIAKADLFSGVNNFQEYGITTKEYSRHYGFTQPEIEELFVSYNVDNDFAQDIKNWYNGYNFHGTEIYNPWSILKCLTALQYRVTNYNQSHEQTKSEILQSYWEESGNVDFVSDLLKAPKIKAKIIGLIEDVPIYFNLKKQITVRDFDTLRKLTNSGSNVKINDSAIDLLFSYLFLSGYLTTESNSKKFRLPNNEIRHEFANKLLEYYETVYNIGTEYLSEVTDKIQLLLDCQDNSKVSQLMSELIEAIQDLMYRFPQFEKIHESSLIEQESGNNQLINANEDIIHGVFTYIILQVRTASIFASEMYLGKGRADLVLIDNASNKCAIIELKYNRTANEAIAQIKEQEYAKNLQKRFETFLIGINVLPDKKVEIKYEVC